MRWSLTHHLDAVQNSGCVYVYAYESRDGSVAGHQMVTVWAGPLQARKDRGTFSPRPSLALIGKGLFFLTT